MIADNIQISLPATYVLKNRVDLEEYISDEISNESGFCHKGWDSYKVEPDHIYVEGILWDIDEEEEE